MTTVPSTRLHPLEMPRGRRRTVTGAGGVDIATYEYGGGSRRPVLFIHGFIQSHLCWIRQLTDAALLDDRRVVAIDLRGHGESGRELPAPAGDGIPPAYAPSDYADDVRAVIDALDLDDPVLVGWSYGGLVIADYVRTHGTGAIGGAVFVGAASRFNPPTQEDAFIGPGFLDNAADLLAPELDAFIRGTQSFLNACFHEAPAPDEFAWHLAYNVRVDVAHRLALLVRPPVRFDEDVLPGLDRPTMVVHGREDTVVLPASGEAIAAAVPGAQTRFYERCGHSPFLEHPEAFNADLLDFLARLG